MLVTYKKKTENIGVLLDCLSFAKVKVMVAWGEIETLSAFLS